MTLHADMTKFRDEHPDMSAEHLAAAFLPHVTKAALLPLITDAFWHIERREVRLIEARVARQALESTVFRPRDHVDDSAIKDLLDRAYRWQTGEERTLRYMTREQHEARIAMLLATRNGIDRAVEVHREAIRLIDANGVDCLADLYVPVAA